MTCLEAQSKIVAFIEDKLSDEELLEFVKHIRNCNNCAEELEIYYTLMIGMKQLDNEENLSADFKKELEDKLNRSVNHIKKTKNVRTSTVLAIIFLICFSLIIAYNNFLTIIYNQEQDAIKAAQSEYFYYDTFGELIFDNYGGTFREQIDQKEGQNAYNTLEFYKRIRGFKLEQDMLNGVNEDE